MRKISLLLAFVLILSTGAVFAETTNVDDVSPSTKNEVVDNNNIVGVNGEVVSLDSKNTKEVDDTETISEEIKLFINQEELFNKINSMKKTTYTLLQDGNRLTTEISPQYVDDVLMIPIRDVLESLGFTVEWNQKEYSVEMNNGPRYTKIYIGENNYSKNKMAPMALSKAPTLINGRTLVPLEFFYEILSIDFKVNDDTIDFLLATDDENKKIELLGVHSGLLINMEDVEGGIKYHIANGEDLNEVSIIVTANENIAIYQRVPQIGEFINILGSPIMLMSHPGQTEGFLFY